MRADQNVMLTCIGPDTPMGALFRRFWIPALLSEEVPSPDCPPVRVTLLGEKLVAFRDSRGKIGLLDAHCPHRRAELFFGRNEESGIRCIYHGWKFDVDGRCVDMPTEPPGSRLHERMCTKAYPAAEQGGVIWAYMGPKDGGAAVPSLDFARVPPSHRYVSKCMMMCNYQQAVEGSIDTAHLSFLHKTLDPADAGPDVFGVGDLLKYSDRDGSPRFFVERTEYGLWIAARRNAEEDSYYWRISQWLMPFYVLVPTAPGLVCRANLFVPIDDEHCWWYRVRWHPERPLTPDEVAGFHSGGLDYAERIPGTYLPRGTCGNDYLLDRAAQRRSSFSGIPSAQLQDIAIQESQGVIVDRTQEHLGTSDAAIIECRRALLEAAKDLQQGTVPHASGKPEAYRVSAVAVTLERDVNPFRLRDDVIASPA